MYDTHHKRTARLYLIAVIFFFCVLGALVYVFPSHTTEELEARLSGSLVSRDHYSKEDIELIVDGARVEYTSLVSGEILFPRIIAREVGDTIALTVDDEKDSILVSDYARGGEGFAIGTGGYIFAFSGGVSTEFLMKEMYYGLVESSVRALVTDLTLGGKAEKALLYEESYLRGALRAELDTVYDVFRSKVDADLENTIYLNDGSSTLEIVAETSKGPGVVLLKRSDPGEQPTLALNSSGDQLAPGFQGVLVIPGGKSSSFVVNQVHQDTSSYEYETDIPLIGGYSSLLFFNDAGELVGVTDFTDPRMYDVATLLALGEQNNISLSMSEDGESVYSLLAGVSRGECEEVEDTLGDFNSPVSEALQLRAKSCVSRTSGGGVVAKVTDHFVNADLMVRFVIGVLLGALLLLFVFVMYLRHQLAGQEKKGSSLERFTSRNY